MERYFVVDGVVAAQTPKIVDAFGGILNEFQTIIEIGFHKGAFTLWLHKNKKEETKLVAYDISFAPKEVHDDNIDFRQGDCFSEEVINEIKDLINNSGKTLLLCDGGSKEVEFNLYSQFIKSGDVIMCHDYAHTPEEFSSITSQINWNCRFESRYDNIKGAVVTNNLEPYHYDTFKNVLWGSFVKK